jgi:hypothetical protein
VRKWGLLALSIVVAATLVACSGSLNQGGDSSFSVGVWEYFVRDSDPNAARRRLGDATAAGFDAVITNSFWEPGQSEPSAQEVTELRGAAEAADNADVKPLLIIQNAGSKTTPSTPALRTQFASYAASLLRKVPQFEDVIIGNEPNLNRFWLPQFGPGGENVSAAAYLRLLAATYDAVKAARGDVRVWGGATAPRGADRPGAGRETTSPTTFIRALGAAYRASGRDRPVMDGFVHHPYPESSAVPIDLPHPRVKSIGLADYDKLVRLLGDAFDGTAQKGSDLPILYGEIGVETTIPAVKRALYTDHEIARTVSEQAQAAAYRRTLELASCQPTVAGVLFFHLLDEPSLVGWQSGVRYVDGTPKRSLPSVQAAAARAEAGTLDAACGS